MTKEMFDEIIDTVTRMNMYECIDSDGDDIELCSCNSMGNTRVPKLHLFKGIDKAAALCEERILIIPRTEEDEYAEWSFMYKGVRVFELVREGEEP